MLTDHGLKEHGWKTKDYEFSHNVGRGGILYQFRNWMLSNLNIDAYKPISKVPYKIVFSTDSSRMTMRQVSFKDHINRLDKYLGNKYEIEIIAVKLEDMTLNDQV